MTALSVMHTTMCFVSLVTFPNRTWLAIVKSDDDEQTAAEIRLQVAALADPDSAIRREARQYFEQRSADSHIPLLVKLLADKDEQFRRGAVLAMATCTSSARKVTPTLLEALANDPSEIVRSLCTAALSQIGPEDHSVLKGLMCALLKDSSELVRKNAVREIRRMSIWPKGCLTSLARGLDDDEVSVRVGTAYALVEKEPAKTVVPMLLRALVGKEGREIAWMADAMSFAVDGRSLFEEKITSTWPEVRAGAILAIGMMGKRDKPSVKRLRENQAMAVKLLKDEDALVRRSASLALLSLVDEKSAAIVSDIVECLRDADEEVRSGCCDVLGGIGPSAQAGVPELIRLLDDQVANVRGQAANALGNIGPMAMSAVPRLTELLKNDTSNHVRWRAADGLRGIGNGAEAAIPALLEALKDDDDELRRRANAALENIKRDRGK